LKLLVGLGNPGRTHVLNRHNLGFLLTEGFVLSNGEEFRKEEFKGQTARLKINGEDVIALKPLTYMNRSGESVEEAMAFYKVAIEDVIVLHDEIDIPPKSFRIKRGGGHGGHNGLRSLMHLGENFLRFRLGVGRPSHPEIEVADYVLGNLGKDELEYWQNEMDSVIEALEMCLTGKVETAMTRFNRKG
jgi:peptidyl-tRNA hydrolase, PTH1 family